MEDIKVYLELEQGKNTEYWKDIVVVTEDELLKLKKIENSKGRKKFLAVRLQVYKGILMSVSWYMLVKF